MAVPQVTMPGSGSDAFRAPVSSVGQIGFLPYFAIMAQLGLLLLFFRQFRIETDAFRVIALVAFAGFAVHAWLPLRFRLTFFALLSALGVALTLGAETSAWLFAVGLALIAICHLPVSARARTGVLVAMLAVLIALRAGWAPAPWSAALWPILGSMFMFRLILYFYDLRHEHAPASPARTFSYFFMLPNVVFPLFPVIDFKNFRRNYFDADAFQLYQTGVRWMLRGAIQLVLYRVIYYYWTLAPSEVATPNDFFQFILANFLLYLRISGLFHLIVGMLYLFGFRLPETHQRYLLAESFTDFWRRINIYWKDFMLKIFYYPTVFRLKHLGATKAMIIATVFVFAMTWFLHAYQWFWLRGSFLLAWHDGLFWAILGGLVVVNALYEVRYGRRRVNNTPRAKVIRVAKIFATFWAICVLWSFWTSESIAQWLALWPALRGSWSWTTMLFPLGVLALIVIGTIELPRSLKAGGSRTETRGVTGVFQASWVTAVSLLVLVAAGVESVHVQMGTQVANVVHTLRSGRLSRLDVAMLERGYYEELLSVDRFNSQLWEVYVKRPPEFLGVEGANLKRFTNDFAGNELMPNRVAMTNYGPITINRWGMRDQDYELAAPVSAHRTVWLGASTVMGWGVADGETFEAILETRLNDRALAKGRDRIEMLNFGVPGYQPPQVLVSLEKALRFSPDSIVYVAAGRELSRAVAYLAQASVTAIDNPYAALVAITSRAGITPGMNETEAVRRLRPFEHDILRAVYQHVTAQARAAGAEPVLIFLPQVRAGLWEEETAGTLELAAEAGFIVVDLSDVYEGHDVAMIRVAEWDDHPNTEGHRLIAERLEAEFIARAELIFGSILSDAER